MIAPLEELLILELCMEDLLLLILEEDSFKHFELEKIFSFICLILFIKYSSESNSRLCL